MLNSILKPLPQKPSPPQSSHQHLSCHMRGIFETTPEAGKQHFHNPGLVWTFSIFLSKYWLNFRRKRVKLISFYVFASDGCHEDCKHKMRTDIWDPKTLAYKPMIPHANWSLRPEKPSSHANEIYLSQEENYTLIATSLHDGIGGSDQWLPPAYWSSSPAKVAKKSRLKSAFFQQPISPRYPDIVHVALEKDMTNSMSATINNLFCVIFGSPQDCPWQAKFVDATPKFHAAQRHCGRGWVRNQKPDAEPWVYCYPLTMPAIVALGPSTEVLPNLSTSFLMIIRRGA